MPVSDYCRALGCNSSRKTNKSLVFFRFPKDDRSQVWVDRAANPKLVGKPREFLWKNARLCNLHFANNAFTNECKNRLVHDALPSLLLAVPVEPVAALPEVPVESLPAVEPEGEELFFFDNPESEVVLEEVTLATPSPKRPRSVVGDEETPTRKRPRTENSPLPAVNPFKTPSPLRTRVPVRKNLRRDVLGAIGATQVTQLTPRKAKLVGMLRKAEKQLDGLKRRCKMLREGQKNLESTLQSNLIQEIEENVSPAAARLFASQLKCGKKAPRGRRYTMEEKIFALSFYKRGPKAYKLFQTMFAVPSPRTLISLLNRVPFLPGINPSVFSHLKEKVSKMNEADKACALLFDEVALSVGLQYSEKLDRIVGFEDYGDLGRTNEVANHALVFMVRGLRKKWKQPVAYFFCKDVTKTTTLESLIVQVVESLQETGLHVVCTICDQGATNRAALKNLVVSRPSNVEIGEHGMIFNVNEDHIAVIYDPPHLLKSTRNAFMKYDVVWTPKTEVVPPDTPQPSVSNPPQRVTASWDHVKMFAERDSQTVLQQAHKLTQAHIEPSAQQKMRVNLAAQLMSQSVAAGIKSMVPDPTLFRLSEPPDSGGHYMPASALGTSAFLFDVDRLFDSFNGTSVRAVDKKYHRVALTANSIHKTFWPEMASLIDSWEFTDKKTGRIQRSPFQDGWLTSIAGATYVGSLLREKYGVRILRLRSLNQDAIENLFCLIRQHGQDNTNPSCIQFTSALKTCIINNLMKVRSRGSNCLADSDVLLSDLKSFLAPNVEEPVAEEPVAEEPVAVEEELDADGQPFGPEDVSDEVENENSEFNLDGYDFAEVFAEILNEMREDAALELPANERPTVAYVCGYIVRKIANLSCERCKELLTVTDNAHTSDHFFTECRERSNRSSLNYVSAQLITAMGLAAQVIDKQLKRAPHQLTLKKRIERQINSTVDFRWFDCEAHREHLALMITLLCRVIIHHFCKKLSRSHKQRKSVGSKRTSGQKRIRKILHK